MEADVTSVPAPPETLPSLFRLRELVDFFVLRTFLEEEVLAEPDLALLRRVLEVRESMVMYLIIVDCYDAIGC